MATTYLSGVVTAYGAALEGGFTGTYEDFCQLMATLPTEYGNIEGSIARPYSSSNTYPNIETYVWHNGILYKNIVPITTAEAWTAAHWTAAVLVDDVGELKSQLSVQTRNILPKQPTAGVITEIDLGSEQTFPDGVNVSFDLIGFEGNGTAGIVRLVDNTNANVALITLNGMRNLETWNAYTEESNPHTGRYTSYKIAALRGSLTFRYVRIYLTSNFVTSGDMLNVMLTAGHNPTPYVPYIEAHDYDLRTLTNPLEINAALNSVSLMDSAFWNAKVGWYRNEHGGMTSLAGARASRLFPCKSGDTLSYTLYMPNTTKVLFTFDQNMQIVRTIDAVDTVTKVTGTLTFTPSEHYFAFNIVDSQIGRLSLKYNDVPIAIQNYVADYVAEYAVGKGRFPDYWDSAVQYAVETIKTNLLALTSGDAFVFVTDQHWVGNAKYSSAIIDYICSECGLYNVFIGGDIINNKNASKLGAMTEMLDYLASFQNPHIRLFATLGNHDQNSVAQSDPTAVLSLAEQYNSLIKPEEQWLDTDGTPLCNIYNNDSQKIRYIQFFFTIDSGYRQDVADLLTSAMQSTPTGWTIVLMSHGYWAGTDPSQGAEDYADLIKGLLDGLNADAPLWVVGHCHADKTAVLTSPGGKTCRIVATTTDSVGQNPSSPSMTAGTTTEQAFDVYCLDTTAKTIKITRIGAGVSRNFTY